MKAVDNSGSSNNGMRRRGTTPAKRQGGNVETRRGRRVAILVLGDIGRSPRMQYHALSLARAGYMVDFIGYAGARPMEEVVSMPSIALHHIRGLPQPRAAPRALFYLYAPLKVVYQVLVLFWVLLFGIARPDVILVQNPPAIPTLMVARACAFVTGARLIIDWHNYGHTILGLKLGSGHPIVLLAEWIEHFFGKSAYAHLCVTKAMAADLRDRWGVSGKLLVLHDRPPRHFRRLAMAEMHRLWERLLADPQLERLCALLPPAQSNASLLTSRTGNGSVEMRADRPMLLVSSTSWTADEDFSVLLDALVLYEQATGLPRLAVIITGQGPLRAHYEAEIARLRLDRVCVVTAWLTAEDYPLLLGSADLGVSLHTSSSGLDLPMKVVDMLGCGAPVCAYRFACIGELVTERNGLLFSTAEELAGQIRQLAAGLGDAGGVHQSLLRGAAEFRRVDWDSNYQQALELF